MMSALDLVVAALVIVPIVLLLSFAGCGIDAVGTASPDIPLPDRHKDDDDKVREPPGVFVPPGGTEVPVIQPDPNRYHNLVLNGPTELIAYWKLEDTAVNGTAADSGPLKRAGIYRGGVKSADGVLRNGPGPADLATEVDGTGRVDVAYAATLNPVSNTDFSLEAWIRPVLPVTGRRVIAGSYRVGAAAGSIDRGFVLELLAGTPPRVRARAAPDGSADAALTGGVAGWHHVVMTYEGTPKRLRLYVDGAAVAVDNAATYVANRQAAAGDVVTALRIGAGQVEPYNAASPPGMYFLGRIDQVALYRGALPAVVIGDHFTTATSP
jgi:hypothetical protein